MATLQSVLKLNDDTVIEYIVDEAQLTKEDLKKFYEIDIKSKSNERLNDSEFAELTKLIKDNIGKLTITQGKTVISLNFDLSELDAFAQFIQNIMGQMFMKHQRPYEAILMEQGVNTQLSQQEKDEISKKYLKVEEPHSH